MTRIGCNANPLGAGTPRHAEEEPEVRGSPPARQVYVNEQALKRWLAGLSPEELAAIRAGRPRPAKDPSGDP